MVSVCSSLPLQYLAWVSKIVPKFFKDLVAFWLILVGRTFAKNILGKNVHLCPFMLQYER